MYGPFPLTNHTRERHLNLCFVCVYYSVNLNLRFCCLVINAFINVCVCHMMCVSNDRTVVLHSCHEEHVIRKLIKPFFNVGTKKCIWIIRSSVYPSGFYTCSHNRRYNKDRNLYSSGFTFYF